MSSRAFAMCKNTIIDSEPKFTKGEKCIFTHLVITFTVILILVIIYAIHLYMVRHTLYGIFNTRRTTFDTKRKSGSENLLVGYLYLNITPTRFVCNTLLLKSRWSVCTAHCVAIRTHPDMAHLLFAWGLKYKLHMDTDTQSSTFVTQIKKSIAHSLFNRETFAYNVGLLEHTEAYPFLVPTLNKAELTLKSEDRTNMFIVGWNHNNKEITDNREIESVAYDVSLNTENCLEALLPVTPVRNYEFCVTLQNGPQLFLDYGAVVFANEKVEGIFSWGERLQKQLPMVVINLTSFHDWIKIFVTS